MSVISEQVGKGDLHDEMLSDTGQGISCEVGFDPFQAFLGQLTHRDNPNPPGSRLALLKAKIILKVSRRKALCFAPELYILKDL